MYFSSFIVLAIPMILVLRRIEQGYSVEEGKSKFCYLHFINDLKFHDIYWNETCGPTQNLNIVTEDISKKIGTRNQCVLAIGVERDCERKDVE